MRRCPRALFIAFTCLFGCAEAEEPFLFLSGPKDLVRIEVRDTRTNLVWSIAADQPKTLEAVYYGVVPEGFVQLAPSVETLPRPLVDRETLVVSTRTLRREFTHYGYARGNRGFQVNHSAMKNLGLESDGEPPSE